jgi:hypothetical protein
MGSVPGRASALESAVSIAIVGVLVSIGVGLLLKQSDADMSRFGMDAAAIGASKRAGLDGLSEPTLASLLPEGFEILSQVETYDPGNLYEKIDGRAPLYTEAGFINLLTQRFVKKDNESLWMELFVYDMAGIRNAFSVYSRQKRPDVEVLPVTRFAYKTSNAVFLVHGKYYVELLGSAESAQLVQAMERVAEKLGEHFAIAEDVEIPQLQLFPEENFVRGSAKLYLANAFGSAELTDVFAATYRFGDESITAFLSRKDSAAEAATISESYYKFLLDNGGKDVPTTDPNVKLVDFYGTLEIISVTGPFVFGIHEAENWDLAKRLRERILDKLAETIKTPQK